MFVCLCFPTTDIQIQELAKERDLTAIIEITKAGTGCGACLNRIKSLTEETKIDNENNKSGRLP